jgi:isopenicillin N synthase-like dioxygenase
MHSVSESEQDNADLTVVNYQRLLSGDEDEELAMYTASSKWGFFYLDLGDFEDPKYLEIVRELFDASKTYFEKSLVEKLKDTRSEPDVFNICGYVHLSLLSRTLANHVAKIQADGH